MSDCVIGAGIDLVENKRIERMIKKWGARFKDKVFLPEEQRYCDSKPFPCRHYAGRFAVKEAVSKAFGTGVGNSVGWLDIEVVRDDETGAPSIRLSKKAGSFAKTFGVSKILVSLSHTRTHTVAHAILSGRKKQSQSKKGKIK